MTLGLMQRTRPYAAAASRILMDKVRCASLLKGSIWQAIGERPWIGLSLALVVILFDQWSKHLAMDTLQFRQPEAVTSWFDWMLTYNTGAAFSFLAEAGGWQRWVNVICKVLELQLSDERLMYRSATQPGCVLHYWPAHLLLGTS